MSRHTPLQHPYLVRYPCEVALDDVSRQPVAEERLPQRPKTRKTGQRAAHEGNGRGSTGRNTSWRISEKQDAGLCMPLV